MIVHHRGAVKPTSEQVDARKALLRSATATVAKRNGSAHVHAAMPAVFAGVCAKLPSTSAAEVMTAVVTEFTSAGEAEDALETAIVASALSSLAAGVLSRADAPTTSSAPACSGAYRLRDTSRSIFGQGQEIAYTIQCTCNDRYFTVVCGNQFDATVPTSVCRVPELLAPHVPSRITEMGAVSSVLCGGRY